jgi:hypothetical protein
MIKRPNGRLILKIKILFSQIVKKFDPFRKRKLELLENEKKKEILNIKLKG